MKCDGSVVDSPERSATLPAMMKERTTAGPASPDATPIRTKMPVPIIAPMPIPAAHQKPMERCNSGMLSILTNYYES